MFVILQRARSVNAPLQLSVMPGGPYKERSEARDQATLLAKGHVSIDFFVANIDEQISAKIGVEVTQVR